MWMQWWKRLENDDDDMHIVRFHMNFKHDSVYQTRWSCDTSLDKRYYFIILECDAPTIFRINSVSAYGPGNADDG